MTLNETKPTLLLAENEETIVNLLDPFISDCGFSVTSFTDSTKAIKEIKKTHYDLILTDLMMPNISGMDIVREVKQSGRDTKIIIFTGFASINSAIEGIQLGVYDYIRKPLKLDEINIVLNRAKNQLYLERENHKLNKQIQKMLADMTMLYDISTILYQIPDFEIAVEIVLDTLTEGMNIENVVLFTDNNQSGKFIPRVVRGLDDSIVNKINIQKDTIVNGVSLSFEEQTVITECGKRLNVSGATIDMPENISQCIFIPVRYYNETLAFIGVLQPDSHILDSNEIKLLAILTTQIAPVFGNLNKGHSSLLSHEMGSLPMIKAKIEEAKAIDGSVSFALLRIFGESDTDYKSLSEKLDVFIKDETVDLNPIVWKGINSWIVATPNTDPVSLEISCAGIRQRMEDTNLDGDKGKVSIQHAITSYPQDGQSPDELYHFLSERIFHETNKVSMN